MSNRFASIACATALASVFTVSLPKPAPAQQVTPPQVKREYDPGNLFRVGQNIEPA